MSSALARAGSARLSVSASQLVAFDQCERSWYLASVARAPDDSSAGGQYLLQGDLFDEAVQRYSARMGLEAADLVDAVRSKPGLRGAALTTPEEDWVRLAERAQRMLRAVESYLPPPKTARIQHKYRVLVPGYEAVGGVVVTGKLDLRRPGEVWDTKSTTDRGPGRGRDADTPPYALTDADTPGGNVKPLAADVQASLYAWCEFMEDPLRLSVRCTWVYSSKPSSGAPRGWAVSHVFLRAQTLAWFDSYVRPRIDRMLELHDASEIVLDQNLARANHDSCGRCFRRLACNPLFGAQAPLPEGAVSMALDLKKMRAEQAAREAAGAAGAVVHSPGGDRAETDLEAQLRASLVAEAAAVAHAVDDRRADAPLVRVDVNRPDAPPNPNFSGAAVIDTTGVEAPAAGPPVEPAGGAAEPTSPTQQTSGVESLSAPGEAPLPAAGAPRRPGRPRKPRPGTGAAEPAAPASGVVLAGGLDAEELEKFATRAQGIADAADSLVSELNAALRRRGVRV